jgi:hypothetical protein
MKELQMNTTRSRLAATAVVLAVALGLLSTAAVDQSTSAAINGHSLVSQPSI